MEEKEQSAGGQATQAKHRMQTLQYNHRMMDFLKLQLDRVKGLQKPPCAQRDDWESFDRAVKTGHRLLDKHECPFDIKTFYRVDVVLSAVGKICRCLKAKAQDWQVDSWMELEDRMPQDYIDRDRQYLHKLLAYVLKGTENGLDDELLNQWQPIKCSHEEDMRSLGIEVIAEDVLLFKRLLGQGGYGAVHEAVWNSKTVAVKKPLNESGDLPIEMFANTVKEVMVHAKARHSNVVQVHATTPSGWLVMELADKDLRALCRGKGLDWCSARNVLLQATKGLCHLHSLDPAVVHSDVKTSNILVFGEKPSNCTVKVADFGLAVLAGNSRSRSARLGGGTLEWMAPELFTAKPTTTSSDVYSVGVVMYEVLTGEHPYGTDKMDPLCRLPEVMLFKKVYEGAEPCKVGPEHCPGDMQAFMKRCISVDPSKRPSMGEIVEHLQRLPMHWKFACQLADENQLHTQQKSSERYGPVSMTFNLKLERLDISDVQCNTELLSSWMRAAQKLLMGYMKYFNVYDVAVEIKEVQPGSAVFPIQIEFPDSRSAELFKQQIHEDSALLFQADLELLLQQPRLELGLHSECYIADDQVSELEGKVHQVISEISRVVEMKYNCQLMNFLQTEIGRLARCSLRLPNQLAMPNWKDDAAVVLHNLKFALSLLKQHTFIDINNLHKTTDTQLAVERILGNISSFASKWGFHDTEHLHAAVPAKLVQRDREIMQQCLGYVFAGNPWSLEALATTHRREWETVRQCCSEKRQKLDAIADEDVKWQNVIAEDVHFAVWRETPVAVQQVIPESQNGMDLEGYLKFYTWTLSRTILDPEHVVRSLGVTRSGAVLMELADSNISHWCAAQPRTSGKGNDVATKVRVLLQAAKALRAVHRLGIIYGDLKSSKFLVFKKSGSDVVVKIAQLKLTEPWERGEGPSWTGHWIAKELCEGSVPSRASDVFSFGMIMYEIMMQGLPYGHEAMEAQIVDLKLKGLDPCMVPKDARGEWPNGFLEMMEMCCSSEPGRRPSMEMVCSSLEALSITLKGVFSAALASDGALSWHVPPPVEEDGIIISKTSQSVEFGVVTPEEVIKARPVDFSHAYKGCRMALSCAAHDHFVKFVKQLLCGLGEEARDQWLPVVLDIARSAAKCLDLSAARTTWIGDLREYVKVECVPGMSEPKESHVIHGVVLRKNRASCRMQSKLSNPRLLLLSGPLEFETSATTRLQLKSAYLSRGKEYLDAVASKIVSCRPNVVLVEKNVARAAIKKIDEEGITLVYNVQLPQLEMLAQCTGAEVVNLRSISEVKQSSLGRCEEFVLMEVIQKPTAVEGRMKRTVLPPLMIFKGCQVSLVCTAVLYGDTMEQLNKLSQVVKQSIIVAYHMRLELAFLADELSVASSAMAAVAEGFPVDAGLDLWRGIGHELVCKSVRGVAKWRSRRPIHSLSPHVSGWWASEARHHISQSKDYVTPVFVGHKHDPVAEGQDANGWDEDSENPWGDKSDSVCDERSDMTEEKRSKAGEKSEQGGEWRPKRSKRMSKPSLSTGSQRALQGGGQGEAKSPECRPLAESANADGMAMGDGQVMWMCEQVGDSGEASASGRVRSKVLHVMEESLRFTSSIAIRNHRRGLMCEPHHLHSIDFYDGDTDWPLSRFLMSIAADSEKHCPHGCWGGNSSHVRTFLHGGMRITLSVVSLPPHEALQNSGQVWFWARPKGLSRQPLTSVRRVPLSPDAMRLSFGAFLDLSCNSNFLQVFNRQLHLEFVRYFGYGRTVVCVYQDRFQPYELHIPPWNLCYNNDNQLLWIIECGNELMQEANEAYTAVEKALQVSQEQAGDGQASRESYVPNAIVKDVHQEHSEFTEKLTRVIRHARKGGVDERSSLVNFGEVLLDCALELNGLRKDLAVNILAWAKFLSNPTQHPLTVEDGGLEAIETGSSGGEKSVRASTPEGERLAASHRPGSADGRLESSNDQPAGSQESEEDEGGWVPLQSHFAEASFLIRPFSPDGVGIDQGPRHIRSGAADPFFPREEPLVHQLNRRLVFGCPSSGLAIGVDGDPNGASEPVLDSPRKLQALEVNLNNSAPLLSRPRAHKSSEPGMVPLSVSQVFPNGRSLISDGQCTSGGDEFVIPVFDDEPGSIIAHVLASNSFRKKLQQHVVDLQALQCPAGERAESPPDERRGGWGEKPPVDCPQWAGCWASGPQAAPRVLFSDAVYWSPAHIEQSFEDDELETLPLSKARFDVMAYFAPQFAQLRSRCVQGGETSFIVSLSRCKVWRAQGGKSKAYFGRTLDERYVIKSISATERDSFLRHLAPNYLKYIDDAIDAGRDICLAKILGMFQVSLQSRIQDWEHTVIIMENVFYDRTCIRKYNLKGSKRGRNNPDAERRYARGEEAIFLDNDLRHHNKQAPPLLVDQHNLNCLQDALNRDTKFLADLGIMDYSLILGLDKERTEIVVGIINFAREYTLDKRFETLIKSSGILGGWGSEPTIISPNAYRTRFVEEILQYFTVVPTHDDWAAGTLGRGAEAAVRGSS